MNQEIEDATEEIARLVRQLEKSSSDFRRLTDSDDIIHRDDRETMSAVKELENLSHIAGMIADATASAISNLNALPRS